MAKLPGRQGEIEMSEMGVACRVQLVESSRRGAQIFAAER